MHPDGGVVVTTRLFQNHTGAHAQSYRRGTVERCGYAPGLDYNEDMRLPHCVGKQAGAVVLLHPADTNDLLLVKVHSELSITSQKFARQFGARLDVEDWRKQVGLQQWWYETMHELTRPAWRARVGGGRLLDHLPDGILSDRRATKDSAEAWWETFHRKHANFFAADEAAVCPGFVRTPGFTHFSQYNTELAGVASAAACCEACVVSGTALQRCAAFTHSAADGRCSFFSMTRESEDTAFPVLGPRALQRPCSPPCAERRPSLDAGIPLQQLPATVLTHQSAVLAAVCSACVGAAART